MLIKSLVTPARDLVTVDIGDTIGKAFNLIEENGFLSVPVLEGKVFKGFLSKQYIYDTFFHEKSDLTWEVYLQQPTSILIEEKLDLVNDDLMVEEAANIFLNSKIRFLPVKDAMTGDFVGILTQRAIFGLVTHVYGLLDPKIVILMDDMKGTIAKITDIISKHGGNIKNIVNFDTEVMGLQELSIRLTTEQVGDMDKILDKLKEAGFKIKSVIK